MTDKKTSVRVRNLFNDRRENSREIPYVRPDVAKHDYVLNHRETWMRELEHVAVKVWREKTKKRKTPVVIT